MERVEVITFLLTSMFLTIGAQWNPHFHPGRQTIVHLFEWKWNNIADECERFLGPYGYGGVQVSPVNENAVVTSPFRPWWERYQPVSYDMQTRSGSEEEFASMVRRCNDAGVKIYVDAIINHMTGGWDGVGTGGTPFYGSTRFEFPGVPYGPKDFNLHPGKCPNPSGSIGNYDNPIEVRNCELSTLRDLRHETEYVRGKIADFMNKLINYGVAGFRIDASKHMWPGDMENIFGRLNNLSTQFGFSAGARPYIYMEVIDLGNEPIKGSDYFGLGAVTEFKYGMFLGDLMRGYNQMKWLVSWGEGWGMYPAEKALAFIDNHDNQRGHGAGGQNILTFRVSRMYKMATAFMLAHPYGTTRVMSSYTWEQNWDGGVDKHDWIGPPNTNGRTNDVTVNPDLTCGGGWMCEHRWRQIYNMVRFRNVVAGTGLNDWWDNGNNQIAFCRGGKGFIAINNEPNALSVNLQTCLPAGQYCDVISGNLENGECTGKIITVDKDGRSNIHISSADEDPVIAIHAEVRMNSLQSSLFLINLPFLFLIALAMIAY